MIWLYRVVALVTVYPVAAQEPAANGSWLDRSLENWNNSHTGQIALPHAPTPTDPGGLPSSCREQERTPANAAEKALADKGWKLYGSVETSGSTVVILAMSDADGMCRPIGYQAFVYSGERYAGTLSPVPMNSRSDGALTTVHLVSAMTLAAEFTRYKASDPLCCPSRISTVKYSIKSDQAAMVTAVDVDTRSTSDKSESPVDAPHDFIGTAWSLLRFQGGDGTVLTPRENAKYSLTFTSDHRVSMQVDCNRGTGSWTSASPGGLQFGPVALTRAMCPESPLNQHLPKDFEHVRSYVLKDGHLFLSLVADGGTSEWEPMSSKPKPEE